MSDAPELLLCPFCGGDAVIDDTPPWVAVVCDNSGCDVVGARKYLEADAIAAWNRRADLMQARIDAAVGVEREACAQIADDWTSVTQRVYGSGGPAAAIRARKGE